MKETVRMVCGLEVTVEKNPAGVMLIHIPKNNGSIWSSTESGKITKDTYPSNLHIIVSPENIPIFKKLIAQFEGKKRKKA